MAKKKTKKAAPTRACESCGTAYHPRSKACPKCGAANPTHEGKGGRRRTGKRRTGGTSSLEAAIDFVEQAGSLKAARAAMDKIEQIRGL